MKDEWVAAALFDDSVVAELLFRLKQSSSSSSSSSCQLLPTTAALSLPLAWGHRQPRSKPNKKDSTTTTTTTIATRCSPTTPLYWSPGGAASPSDGACDDSSNSSAHLPQSSSSSDPSRSKDPDLSANPGPSSFDYSTVVSGCCQVLPVPYGIFSIIRGSTQISLLVMIKMKMNSLVALTNDTLSIHSNNKKSKKKTFAELKEEEAVLLRESITLKRELASLHVTLKEQKARSKNLKRFKIDLNLQASAEMCGHSGDVQVGVYSQHNQMEASTSDQSHSGMPRHAAHIGFGSSGSCRVEKEVDKSCFVLPDLNMMPSEGELAQKF